MERNLIAVYNMNGSYYLYIKELQNPDDSYCANLIMCKGIIECKIAISELKKYKEYVDNETLNNVAKEHNSFIKSMLNDKIVTDDMKEKCRNVLITNIK